MVSSCCCLSREAAAAVAVATAVAGAARLLELPLLLISSPLLGAVRDCEQGARTTIKLCVEDLPTDGSQVYFADCRATSPAGIAL